jgi:hypothetical protein
LLLPWNHLKLGPKHKMIYNLLSAPLNSLNFWETHLIYVFYICSKFQLYWWWPQRVITLKKIDFKIETKTIDAWISLNTSPNDMKFLSHMYSFMIYKIPKLHIQKCSNKGDMTKKPDLPQSPQKVITLTKHMFFFWKFENRSVL